MPAVDGEPVPAVPEFGARPVLVVAAVLIVVQLLLAGRYGFHRDELYFMVAGRHLAWGYTDQPPLTPLLARVSVDLFGATPTGLRVVPALLGGLDVLLVALLARELGGGRPAQRLAAVGAACSAIVLGVGHMLSTVSFDLVAWLALALLTLRLLRTGERRWWLAIGAATGLALLNKDLVVLLVPALVPAVWVLGPRRVLRGWWPPAGVLVALAVAAPNLWWEARHGWPELTVAGGISGQDGLANRITFVPMQLLYLSPVLVPVCLAGLRRLWSAPELRWARAFAVGYPVVCLLVLVSGGKPYYALPLLLVPMAAGCEPRVRRPLRRFALWLAFGALLNAVITLPVLPARALPAVNWIYPEQGAQLGWPRLVAAVGQGWAQLPATDRSRAVVFTANYGEAGAIAQYGARYGLPEPYSGHMSFADWGPPPDGADGPVLVVEPAGPSGLTRAFTGCRQVAVADNGVGVATDDQDAAVLLCTGTVEPWSKLWPHLRHYY
ncbi:glycosyltransferase family 39 protein [Kitasatospora viridis]